MKNQKYILCTDIERDGKVWQQPVSKDVLIKEDVTKDLADSFYLKGDGVAAATIMADFKYLDALLDMLSVKALFIIPIGTEEVILRLDETLAKQEIASFNASEEEPRYSLYKYEQGTLSRMTTE